MNKEFAEIQELLRKRADVHSRLALLPYDGSPEIKERDGRKYLYVRRRVASKNTSTYVDVYSDELYQLLLRNNREARELKKNFAILTSLWRNSVIKRQNSLPRSF